MSLSTDVTRLKNAKAALKTSINSKGGTIAAGLIDTYAAQVDALTVADLSGVTALAADVRSPKVFVNSSGAEVTGTLADHAATLINFFEGDLTTIAIPTGTTKLHAYTLYKQLSLTSIDIPDSVTLIEGGAFAGCASLAKVWIPSEVITIDDASGASPPFGSCPSTCEVYCEAASIPAGWVAGWNHYTGTSDLTAHWGATHQQFVDGSL